MTCTLNGIYAQTAETKQKVMIAKTVKTKETMSDKDRAIEHSIITFELMLKWKLTDRQKAAIQTNIDYLKSIN